MPKKISEFILFQIFTTVLFQSVAFFFDLSILGIFAFFAPFLWLAYRYFFVDNKKLDKSHFLTIGIVYATIIVLNLYFMQFHETTYDGGYYHGNAMVEMLNGWNPFLQASQYKETGVTIWSDYYPKVTWIYSAVLIQVFKNLSSGMIINFLIAMATSFYIYDFCIRRLKNKFYSILIALVVFLNPIFIEQLHSYYVDGLLANLVILLLFMGIDIIEKYDMSLNFNIFIVSVLMINVKFTGFGYAGIINFIIWLYFIFKNKRAVLPYTLFGISMLLVGLCVIGYSPYLVNISNGRHIFYPIAGKDAEDVVSYLIPLEIRNKGAVQKLIYSLNSGMSFRNNLFFFGFQPALIYDQQIGAMGIYFTRMLLFSCVAYIGVVYQYLKSKKTEWSYVLMGIALVVTLLANYANIWWLRYAGQIWVIVPIAMVLVIKNLNKKFKAIFYILLIFVLFQNLTIIKNTVETDYAKSRSIEAFYTTYKNSSIDVTIVNHDYSDVFWFDAYEMARAKQEGVVIKNIKHGQHNLDKEDCYHMHVYKLCVLE